MARTILVVEDEPTLRETIVDALESDGFRVIAAADGREALAKFRGERPDLVLLDLMLPELSGIEVTRIIRAESGVPIVMLTAKDSELDKVVGLELGADDYVTKPFSLRELTARVRALFRRSEAAIATGAPPTIVDLGRVQADLGGHRLLRDGEVLPIKPKAFELLAFLSATRARSSRAISSSRRCGGTTTPARRARSMSMSTGCAARSRRIRASRPSSTRCAAWATCSAGPLTGDRAGRNVDPPLMSRSHAPRTARTMPIRTRQPEATDSRDVAPRRCTAPRRRRRIGIAAPVTEELLPSGGSRRSAPVPAPARALALDARRA